MVASDGGSCCPDGAVVAARVEELGVHARRPVHVGGAAGVGWGRGLHGAPVPNFPSYFSGAPVVYPPLGAMAAALGGLYGARILSLFFMLFATVLLHGVTRRIYDRRSANFAAAIFAGLGATQFLGAFATYDAMALMLLG